MSLVAVFRNFQRIIPVKTKANHIWREIAKNRNILRKNNTPWEEDWGGYKEVHWEPIEVTGVRLNFWSGYVGLDEVEIFGLPSENFNLAHASNGTKVHTDVAFDQQGGRFPVSRLIDGKYGTQRWQASYNKQKKQNPWIEFIFEKPVTVGRLRMSSNREYYLKRIIWRTKEEI